MATMIILLAALQIVTLVVVFVLLRKTSAPAQDPRLNQLADTLPTQLTRLDTRFEGLDHHLRSELAQLRTDAAAEARRTRESAATDFTTLRTEITNNIAELSNLLNTSLNAFRADNKSSDETLRTAVQQNLDSIAQRLTYFISDVNRSLLDAREALHSRLNEISGEASNQQEKLRFTVEDRLTKLNVDNTAKLEEMRVTVDEKLHATLQTRLTESFGQVTTHLGEVQKGLGEMKELATGVGDLKKVLSNVKARGVVGEFQLGQQLEQMFSPEQYIKNARIKQNTQESVEYALKFPMETATPTRFLPSTQSSLKKTGNGLSMPMKLARGSSPPAKHLNAPSGLRASVSATSTSTHPRRCRMPSCFSPPRRSMPKSFAALVYSPRFSRSAA